MEDWDGEVVLAALDGGFELVVFGGGDGVAGDAAACCEEGMERLGGIFS